MIKKSILKFAGGLALCLAISACSKKFDPASGAAPPPQVVATSNTGLVTVAKPERFSWCLRAELNFAPS